MTLSSGSLSSCSSPSSSGILPGEIDISKKSLVKDFHGFIYSRIVVAFVQFCIERKAWCKVPRSYLLNIEELQQFNEGVREVLVDGCFSFLWATGRFRYDKEGLFITEAGIVYFNKNYPKK
jgi:hypothetical protein